VSGEWPGTPGGVLPGGGLAAGSVVAGYRLEEQIGQGGMAVVFRAVDEQLGRRVALKVLSETLAGDDGFRQRFIRESRAAAAVDDPHIIPVYGAGEAGGVLYIAMRFVPGGDVRSLVRREGPLQPDRVAAIISPVASALDAAHAAGLVHRDVKPANMLLDARPGRPDHVYLSDFGLSKAWQGSTGLTGSGLFLGTVDYAAPEQLEGRAVDGRADQYALACAAFELLAGEPPFRRDQGLAVVYAHLSAPPPQLTQRLPWLGPAADAVLACALAKTPEGRYGSCGEFARELRQALALTAYPSGPRPGPPAREATEIASPYRAAHGRQATSHPRDAGSRAATRGPALASHRGYAVPPATGSPRYGPRRKRRTSLLISAAAIALLVIAGLGAVLATRQHKQAPLASSAGTVPASHQAPAHPGRSAAPPARAKVCTYPAVSCAVSAAASMRTKPARIVTSADGSGFVKDLTWSGWGEPTAHATGTLEVDDCSPDCADGAFTAYPATITLSGLTPYGDGENAYARMVIIAPAAPFPPQTFKTGLVP